MQFHFTLSDLQAFFPEGSVSGGLGEPITGIAALEEAQRGDVSFLGNPRYRDRVPNCAASLILLPLDYEGAPRDGQAYLRVKDPSTALAYLCQRIEQAGRPRPAPGIHPSAVIAAGAAVHAEASIGPLCWVGAGARIGKGTILHSHVSVGAHAQIGEDCHLKPRVTIGDYCRLGDRVAVDAGSVIGSDGFGYRQEGEAPNLRHIKIPQIGMVVLEDDVDVGANSTIDRARFGETRIGLGSKIDNLVHIAHNCRIGRHCVIIAQVGISGSTTLEDYVVMWGQAGTVGHITLGMGSFIGAQAGVSKSVAPGAKVSGTPAFDLTQRRRMEALERKLPDLFKRVAKLEDLTANKCETANRV